MPLLPVVLSVCLLVGLLGAFLGLRDRPPGRLLLQGVLALQALLLAQAVVAVVRLLGDGPQPPSVAVFAGYLVLSVLLLPGAFALVVEERTRFGSLLLGGACLVVAVVEVRLRATA